MRKVLITGANGQLGCELRKQLKQYSMYYNIKTVGREELDISQVQEVKTYMMQYKPHIVINCAAYTSVDQAEVEVQKAQLINVIGTINIVKACKEVDAKFIYVSTDYVFDGGASLPYREGDQVNPQNVYGKSKLAGEEAVRRLCKKHFILRTAWLYGEGNNFVRTMLKLAQTTSQINVVGDQFGTPTYTKDLAKVIIELMQTEYYGTYHATCEGSCSWYDFACEIFRLKHLNVKVHKVTSEEFLRPAKRPQYAVLENAKLKKIGLNTFRSWQEALADYLEADAAWQEENLGGKANG
ncbi:dTDP-4-dehydrorhamnose reductase [Zhenhengia sp.]|uniref:dTDP-4-dehydrorhamnose reductase n=1 Tax=Zhenhengia sp. TaxID=2944208 RepID=UPI00307946A1